MASAVWSHSATTFLGSNQIRTLHTKCLKQELSCGFGVSTRSLKTRRNVAVRYYYSTVRCNRLTSWTGEFFYHTRTPTPTSKDTRGVFLPHEDISPNGRSSFHVVESVDSFLRQASGKFGVVLLSRKTCSVASLGLELLLLGLQKTYFQQFGQALFVARYAWIWT